VFVCVFGGGYNASIIAYGQTGATHTPSLYVSLSHTLSLSLTHTHALSLSVTLALSPSHLLSGYNASIIAYGQTGLIARYRQDVTV